MRTIIFAAATAALLAGASVAQAQMPDPAEIISWARDELANYKVPKTVHIVDALPFNAGGKVMKFELRQRLEEAPQ